MGIEKQFIIAGILLIIFATPVGLVLSKILLDISGGMSTDQLLIVIDRSIAGFQIIGALLVGAGILRGSRGDKA